MSEIEVVVIEVRTREEGSCDGDSSPSGKGMRLITMHGYSAAALSGLTLTVLL